jgi:hypothetical protein
MQLLGSAQGRRTSGPRTQDVVVSNLVLVAGKCEDVGVWKLRWYATFTGRSWSVLASVAELLAH